ncbi:MAG TPA: hypothetical protein VF553_01550 [Pyrinomonadaceae bacterium]|jgi:hypothetical protein
MAQCKKLSADAERCSNRAVPGADYCWEHRLAQPLPAEDEGVRTARKSRKKSRVTASERENEGVATWAIRASASGETPSFPGLRADARNILVAPQGVILLRERKSSEPSNSLGSCLSRLLGCLSHEFPLAENIHIRKTLEGDEALILLRPPEPETSDLSRFYDGVAAAAALSESQLYIGQGRAFIRYRDGEAARGYVADDVELPAGDDLFLLDHERTYRFAPGTLTELALPDLLLAVSTLPAREVELPPTAFALVATPLYRMVARYLRDHHLRYSIARFHTPEHETLTLFEITARRTAPTGPHVPSFVLRYLENLPRSVVLTEVWAHEGSRMLVQWGGRYPGNPRHVLPVFPPDSLLLFNSDGDYPNLCVTPMPVFFEGDDVTSAQTPRPVLAQLRPLNDQESLPLELPVRLVEDTGAVQQTSALILDEEEIRWLRRLLYRLPGEAFNAYSLCMGEGRAVLLAEAVPVESLPFGIALQRVQDTQLFIPLRTRFAPDLPWALLSQALELKDDVYTFLTEEFRLDIPRASFTPLARALVAEKERQPQAFTLGQTQGWPELKWKPHPKASQSWRSARESGSSQASQQGGSQRQGLLGRLRGGRVSPPHQDFVRTATRREAVPNAEQSPEQLDEAEIFRRRAESFLQSGDQLSAAFCFALAGDNYNAARSFQEAARRMKEGLEEREEARG